MGMSAFISHSQKDTRLVNLVRQALPLAGAEVIVYEDLPPAPSENSADAKRIKQLVRNAKAVLLFHTPNVEASEFTKAWVQYEIGQASAHDKNLVVFQSNEQPPKMPITYLTDLAPLDLEVPETVPKMQLIARSHAAIPLREKPLARAAAGAAGGSILGPLGAAAGAILGLATTPRAKLRDIPQVQCSCKSVFRYWGAKPSAFHCPSCLRPLSYQ